MEAVCLCCDIHHQDTPWRWKQYVYVVTSIIRSHPEDGSSMFVV